MARDRIRDRDWRTLIWSIRQGSCILFLGNDVQLDVGADGESTLHAELAEYLHEGLEQADAPAHALRDVAYAYQSENGRADLNREVVEFMGDLRDAPSRTIKALASLPWRLVIDASFDDHFARALQERDVYANVEHYNFHGNAQDLVPEPSARAPLVYHLYGRVSDPDSLVLTEDDMLEFLVSVISSSPKLPANLSSEFRRPGCSFLFVGFGLRHPYLRVLLHVLRMQDVDARSIALEQLAAAEDGGGADTGPVPLLLKRGYKIRMLEQPVADFCEDLAQRFAESEAEEETEAKPAPSEPAAQDGDSDTPRVFISYASEDAERANWLHDGLEAADFDAWLDTTELRGGDQWDELIQRQVENSDYFLVLQSHALANKKFSYVNAEINVARKRQLFARAGVRFIVPLAIDDSSPLEEFASIQSEPLKNDDDLRKLITLLRRDQRRRKKAG